MGNRHEYLFKPTYFNITQIKVLCDSVKYIIQNDFLNKEYLCMCVEVFYIPVHKFLSHLGKPIFKHIYIHFSQEFSFDICFKLITIHAHQIFFNPYPANVENRVSS